MPICPKCGKLIGDKKFKRHLSRCGQTHRRTPRALDRGGDNFYMKI